MRLACVAASLVMLLEAGQGAPMFSERVLALKALFQKTDISPDRLRDEIGDGLADPDPRVQEVALALLAARAGGFRFDGSAEVRRRWEIERPVLEPLRPAARRLFASPDESVRRYALLALGNLEAKPGHRADFVALGEDVVALFADRYSVDTSAGVRSEIVKALSFDRLNEGARPTIINALSDPDPYVVQFAIHGVERHRLAAQVPVLAAHLKHPSHIVRMAAAGVLGTFGADAARYLPDLRRALRDEVDPLTRATMEGAISVLEKGGASRPSTTGRAPRASARGPARPRA